MKTLFVPLLCAIALAWAPPELLKGDPAKLLMPFLGLLMAGIFPAISLTINSLKSGGFSVQRIGNLADELRKLLNYLQALFIVALIAALCLVTAEALGWGRGFSYPNYSSRVFNFVLGGCLGVLIGSLPRLRRSFTALLDIGRDIAIDEASTKIKDRAARLPSIVDRFPTKEKFGELFESRNMNEVE